MSFPVVFGFTETTWLPAESGEANDTQPVLKGLVMSDPIPLHNIRFPTNCPQCLQPTGVVRKAATVLHQPSVMRLTMQCTICQNQWLLDGIGEPHTIDGASGISDESTATPYAVD